MTRLLIVWDSVDGRTWVTEEENYLKFCREYPYKRGYDYWSFEVHVLEVGKEVDDMQEWDTSGANAVLDSDKVYK